MLGKVVSSVTSFGRSTVGPAAEMLGIAPPGWSRGTDERNVQIINPRGSRFIYVFAEGESEEQSLGMYFLSPPITEPTEAETEEGEEVKDFSKLIEAATVIITGVSFQDSDITSETYGFNNFRLLQVFGKNIKKVSMQCEALIGSSDKIVGQKAVQAIEDWFNKHRVSESMSYVKLGCTSKSEVDCFYVTSLEIMPMINEFHILPFVLSGYISNDYVSTDKRSMDEFQSRIASKNPYDITKEKKGMLGRIKDKVKSFLVGD